MVVCFSKKARGKCEYRSSRCSRKAATQASRHSCDSKPVYSHSPSSGAACFDFGGRVTEVTFSSRPRYLGRACPGRRGRGEAGRWNAVDGGPDSNPHNHSQSRTQPLSCAAGNPTAHPTNMAGNVPSRGHTRSSRGRRVVCGRHTQRPGTASSSS